MIKRIELLKSYQKFIKGKRQKTDIQKFILNCEEELVDLHNDIVFRKYRHGKYEHFRIFDPKLREIDKASVRDRIVHQLVYDHLVGIYDKKFYFHSYAARKTKGTHKAIKLFRESLLCSSGNSRRPTFILKCDIKKFFANIDKPILIKLLKSKITDDDYLFLIKEIIYSFNPNFSYGIPLGNLTSQIFANIYLNELDRFIKHRLKFKYYIRFMDDFVVIGKNIDYLKNMAGKINEFLQKTLKINLHPDKIIIRRVRQGTDFLGYVNFPYHAVLRTKTKKRMLRKIKKKQYDLREGLISEKSFNQSVQSYLGVLSHCSSFKLRQEVLNLASGVLR